MVTKEIDNLPIHEEIAFFEPLLQVTRKLLDALQMDISQQDTEELDCNYVPTKGKQRTWNEIYLVRDEWHFFRLYFMGKAPMLYYWEPPMRGLVNKDPAFWVFSRPEYLKNLCLREQFKVNEFTPDKPRKLPFQNIEHHFQKELSMMLLDESKVYSSRAQECEKYLKLATAYLPKKQAVELHQLVRVLLKVGLHQEIKKLTNTLADHQTLVDQGMLKKRMRAVHTVAMKYYFARAGDDQKRKIDSLVGRDKGHQKQALEYVQRIVSRSFQASVKK
ncbi:MAG: hypothetical protein HQM13_08005 [SAR324 cluster bacterium]|nr:hypothetical protein [SAR324 cluster bacterium]